MKIVGLMAAAAALVAGAPAGAQLFGTNLVTNGDAEASVGGGGDATGAPGFTVTTGGLAVVRYSTGGGYPGTSSLGVTAANGLNFFAGASEPLTIATQRIALGSGASIIDAGGSTYTLSGLLGGFASQNDNVGIGLAFLNAGDLAIGAGLLTPVLAAERNSDTGFLARSASGAVPIGARFADLTLTFTRTAGSANDGYLDNLSLVLSPGAIGSPVPEPASWALMICGVGLVGGALRRRSFPVRSVRLARI